MNNWRAKKYKRTIPFHDDNELVEWMKIKAGEVKEFDVISKSSYKEADASAAEELPDGMLERERMKIFRNKEIKENEWKQWREQFASEREKFWLEGCVNNPDSAWEYFMTLQHYKLQWMIFYFENLGHSESNGARAREMRFASCLIEIILCKGYDKDIEKLPYVNYRNAHRFQEVNTCGMGFGSRRAEVRFCKAYCLYFELIKTHLMTWTE